MTELIELATGLTLIVAGVFSSLALIERLVGVIEENVQSWESVIRWIGFTVGLFGLFMSMFLIMDSGELLNIALLLLVGLALTLRPIKSVPWAALIAIIISFGICTGYVVFAGSVSDDYRILALLFFGVNALIYLNLKSFEDLSRLFGELLASPPVAIPIGLISILQGILVVFFPPGGILELIPL